MNKIYKTENTDLVRTKAVFLSITSTYEIFDFIHLKKRKHWLFL